MSVTTQAAGSIFQILPFPVRRFTVDEYHRMIQTGVLAEDDLVELLEGWIVNLEEAKVEVYTASFELDTGSAYRQRLDYAADEFVPLIIEGQEIERIPVQELMP